MNIKNRLRTNFKNHRLLLIVLFVISIVLTLWINFFQYLHMPMLFKADPNAINRLIETISIAYMTSYLFYYVVVILKEKRDLDIIMPIIADFTYYALNNSMTLAYALRSKANIKSGELTLTIHDRNINNYPSNIDINNICSNVNPNKIETNEEIGLNTNFYTYIIQSIHKIDFLINIILENSRFLEIDLLRILTDIKTHRYHLKHLQSSSRGITKINPPNLWNDKKQLLSYFDLFRKLEGYAEKKLKKHVKHESLIYKE